MDLTDATLLDLGWRPFFQQQLTLDEWDTVVPARVIAVQRSGLTVVDGEQAFELPLGPAFRDLDPEDIPTVGDWVLVNKARDDVIRLLERISVFKRVGAGDRAEIQLIGANIDTLLIVTACNQEFNIPRLERYLALALSSDVEPVVVLTKADLSDDVERYVNATRELRADVAIEVVNALDEASLTGIRNWCRPGQTLALLGSSGVGKSTLVNSLAGAPVQLTGAIREQDARGRHTTTSRSLHLLPGGGLVLDSPGMRELKLADSEKGVLSLFEDVEAFQGRCRFGDCQHESEPGCAVRAAIDAGELDERRFASYQKLLREEAHNTMSVAERRQRGREFNKMVRQKLATHHKTNPAKR